MLNEEKKNYIEKLLAKGLELHKSSKILEAHKIYCEVLQVEPENFTAMQLIGLACIQVNNHQDAINFLEKAIKINSKFVACYVNLGIAFQSLNRFDEALVNFDKAINIDPYNIQAYSNRGISFYSLKRFTEALESYDKAISINPNYADAYSNRGNVLHELKLYEEALKCYDKAIKIKPESPDAYLNRGNTLCDLKRIEEGLKSYEKSIAYKPNDASLYYSIGNAHQSLKNFASALACYEKGINLNPNHVDCFLNRGAVLQKLKRFEEALDSYNIALTIRPDYAMVLSNRGFLLKELKRFDEALDSFNKALEIDPKYKKSHTNRGLVLLELNRYDDAVEAFKVAITLDTNDAQSHYNLGVVLHEQGKHQEAVNSYRKALEIEPEHTAYHNILWIKSTTGISNPADYLLEAKKWEKICLINPNNQFNSATFIKRKPLVGRRLKVGYVSGDFYTHVISYFIEEIFRQHDRTRVEVFAYYANSVSDNTTTRLMSYAEHWFSVFDLSNTEFYERINEDEIDILIDLAGFTGNNRMAVFAKRAAPVQVHYLGYPGSTGLTQMDYWIGDKILTPMEIQHHFSEKIWQLPRVWISYFSSSQAPEIKWVPADDGSICIGTFNKIEKLTDETIVLWSKILEAIPQSFLLFNTRKLSDAGNRERLLNWFNKYGISKERIKLKYPNAQSNENFLSAYDELDIALDPFGAASGGTTTCDALFMGVPVITLVKEGNSVASRISASILHAVGHSEWVAKSETEYLDKVVALASDVEQRKGLRLNQRKRILESPLCDTAGLSKLLENTYEAMYKRWYKNNSSSK